MNLHQTRGTTQGTNHTKWIFLRLLISFLGTQWTNRVHLRCLTTTSRHPTIRWSSLTSLRFSSNNSWRATSSSKPSKWWLSHVQFTEKGTCRRTLSAFSKLKHSRMPSAASNFSNICLISFVPQKRNIITSNSRQLPDAWSTDPMDQSQWAYLSPSSDRRHSSRAPVPQ